jgi:hypothetical protein
MQHVITVVLVIGLVVGKSLGADSFYLQSKSGEKYGPFEFREGVPVHVGRQDLTVAKVLTDEQQIEEQLKNIWIPEFNFKDAGVEEILTVLQGAVHKSEVSSTNASRRAVTLVLAPGYDGTSVNGTWDALSNTVARMKAQTITIAAQNASLRSALDAILPMLGMKYLIRNGSVLVVDENAPESPLIRKEYVILPQAHERLSAVAAASNQAEGRAAASRAWLTTLGVRWPNGSSFEYTTTMAKAIAVNTKENLEVLDGILDTYASSQIEIEFQFVTFERTDIAKAATSGLVEVASLLKLRGEGKGELLAAPKVVTQPNVQATVKAVKEYIYPTELRLEPTWANTNTVTHVNNSAAVPANFETREVGTILSVLVDVSPGTQLMNLTLSPEFVYEPEWKTYDVRCSDATGGVRRAGMEQPFFYTLSLSTSLLVTDGQTVLAGGGMTTRDGNKIVYTFVTARLLRSNGKPLASGGAEKNMGNAP